MDSWRKQPKLLFTCTILHNFKLVHWTVLFHAIKLVDGQYICKKTSALKCSQIAILKIAKKSPKIICSNF